eukprot:6176565-Pleurochrysis_carterae.AAC.5
MKLLQICKVPRDNTRAGSGVPDGDSGGICDWLLISSNDRRDRREDGAGRGRMSIRQQQISNVTKRRVLLAETMLAAAVALQAALLAATEIVALLVMSKICSYVA